MLIKLKISGRVVDIPADEANKLIFGGFAEILDTPPAIKKENALRKGKREKRNV